MTLETTAGAPIDVQGRISGSLAFARFQALAGLQAEHAQLLIEHGKAMSMIAALKHVLDAAGFPAWVRDSTGRLNWVNATYCDMVEGESPAAVVAAGTEAVQREGPRGRARSPGRRRDLQRDCLGGDPWRPSPPAQVRHRP
ncbi:MAG: hypothetical protein H6891_08145 [Brucellaceae bacterium]|nr:hypothetical protein [Brucellaceae bacterium]